MGRNNGLVRTALSVAVVAVMAGCGGGGGGDNTAQGASEEAAPGAATARALGMAAPTGAAPLSPAAAMTARLSGGAFQNVIAVSPFLNAKGERPYLAGGDFSGVYASNDKGLYWTARSGPAHVAGILWSRSVPHRGKVFAAAADGLYLSTDFGQTWARQSTQVKFDAHSDPQRTGRPRATGTLLAETVAADGTGKILWAATPGQGLLQSVDDGRTWRATALQGDVVRSVVLDPNNPDRLYVTVSNRSDTSRNGIWLSTNARSAGMVFSRVAGYPGALNQPQNLLAMNDAGVTKLFVAGGQDGIFMYSRDRWSTLNTGLDVGQGSAAWLSMAGYRQSAGNLVLYASAQGAPGKRAVMKSVDGGAAWTPISDAAHSYVDWNVYGTGVESSLKSAPAMAFAAPTFTASHVAFDPELGTVLVAGTGGTWFGRANGPTATAWQPAVHGQMNMLVGMAVGLKLGHEVADDDAASLRNELAFIEGKTGALEIRRVYDGGFKTDFMDKGGPDIGKRATHYSFKPDMARLEQGLLDTQIQALLGSIPRGHRTILTIQHEPDHPEKPFQTEAQKQTYRNAWKRFAGIVRAQNRPELSTCWVMMAYSWRTAAHRNPEDWWPGDGVVDSVGFDVYNEGSLSAYKNPGDVTDDSRWDSLGGQLGMPRPGEVSRRFVNGQGPVPWARAKGLRWGVPEFGSLENDYGLSSTWTNQPTMADWLIDAGRFLHEEGADFAAYFHADGRPVDRGPWWLKTQPAFDAFKDVQLQY